MKPFLKVDEKISLHLPRPELAEAIFSTVNTQRLYLRKWLPWVDSTQSPDDTFQYIEASMQKNSSGALLTTFIYYEGIFAGSVGFVSFKRKNKSGEIGYWLRDDLQGKGIMTKACERLINYAFRTKKLNRIEIMVAKENQKSYAIPLRLGFIEEGTLREGLFMYEAFYDLKLFSLLKKDWKKASLLKQK